MRSEKEIKDEINRLSMLEKQLPEHRERVRERLNARITALEWVLGYD